MRNLRIVAWTMAVLALFTGLAAAPAQAATYGTYADCRNGIAYYAVTGVYWETGSSSSSVRPYQVWFNQAAAGIYSMQVKYYTGSTYRAGVTFSQSGQTTQVHNWTGLSYGAKNTTTWVDFKLVLRDGRSCTSRVYAVTT